MHYQKHIFICTNQREPGRTCCNNIGANEMVVYVKQKLADLELSGPGKIRLSSSGCMGRCKSGPTLVIYPDATWYRYQSKKDIDEIIEQHLVKGRTVKHLLMQEQ